jgi:hypothetical protein
MKNNTTPALIARKELIAKIAQRHAADREFINSLNTVKSSTKVATAEEVDFAEELETLQKASTLFVG